MKHQARNKKNAKKIVFKDLLERVFLSLTQYPTPMQTPFLRKSGQPLNQPPKPPTQRIREKRLALLRSLTQSPPCSLSHFFFIIFPIILTFEYIKKPDWSSSSSNGAGWVRLVWILSWNLLFCFRVQPREWVAASKRPIFVVPHPRQGCAQERK